jgi:hypothetical protein
VIKNEMKFLIKKKKKMPARFFNPVILEFLRKNENEKIDFEKIIKELKNLGLEEKNEKILKNEIENYYKNRMANKKACKPTMCPNCKKIFKKKSTFENHLKNTNYNGKICTPIIISCIVCKTEYHLSTKNHHETTEIHLKNFSKKFPKKIIQIEKLKNRIEKLNKKLKIKNGICQSKF